MLFLQFKMDEDRYLIEAKGIIEIIPFVELKKIPKAPPYVAGLLNFRGQAIPVIDTCCLMTDKRCELKLSTRIALANFQSRKGESVCLGLLIEHLTETVIWDEKAFSHSGVTVEDKPFLGDVASDEKGIVQKINIDKILSKEACQVLLEH